MGQSNVMAFVITIAPLRRHMLKLCRYSSYDNGKKTCETELFRQLWNCTVQRNVKVLLSATLYKIVYVFLSTEQKDICLLLQIVILLFMQCVVHVHCRYCIYLLLLLLLCTCNLFTSSCWQWGSSDTTRTRRFVDWIVREMHVQYMYMYIHFYIM